MQNDYFAGNLKSLNEFNMNRQPIGIFDSGIGGTSIWKKIHQRLPFENTIYLADSKNAPYGSKGKERILELSIKNTELLLNKDCKLIVVACNTATTNAISYLRSHYNVPFIGIEPSIKPAALQTKSKTIGVLATKGTLSSNLFHKTSDVYSNGITVIEQIGEGIVPLVEAGKMNSDAMKTLLQKHLKPMLKANIDYLVLGCTHYSFLIPTLKTLLPKHVSIIDSGEAVARQTQAVLKQHNLLNKDERFRIKNEFYSNGNPEIMTSILDTKFKAEYLDF